MFMVMMITAIKIVPNNNVINNHNTKNDNSMIIIILVINFMQGIYNYIPETNNVCNVISPVKYVLYFYISTYYYYYYYYYYYTLAMCQTVLRKKRALCLCVCVSVRPSVRPLSASEPFPEDLKIKGLLELVHRMSQTVFHLT